MAGLASLTADYSDSEEDEEEREEQNEEEIFTNKQQDLVVATSARSTPSKPARLVSYLEEEDEEEQEEKKEEKKEEELDNKDKNDDVVPMDLDSENDGEGGQDEEGKEENEEEQGGNDGNNSSNSGVEVEAWSGVKLPPEPQGECDPELQESIRAVHKRKVERGYDINNVIQSKKAFRNPSIYEKLIQFCEINETGTNFPKELHDGHLFGKESYYEQLAKVQASEMERREKMAKSRNASSAPSTAPPTAANMSKSKSKSEAQKRKSKWDQGGSTVGTLLPNRPKTKPVVPLPSVPAPQVVSAGSSGKAISAFGPLKK